MVSLSGALALQQWFHGSAVLDDQGHSLIVYHGTRTSFSRFSATNSGSASGHPTASAGFFFSSSPEVASSFAGEHSDAATWPVRRGYVTGANVMPVYLAIRRPRRITAREFCRRFVSVQWSSTEVGGGREFASWARESDACDGVLIKADPELGESLNGDEYAADTWIAFEPSQIVSAFDPFR